MQKDEKGQQVLVMDLRMMDLGLWRKMLQAQKEILAPLRGDDSLPDLTRGAAIRAVARIERYEAALEREQSRRTHLSRPQVRPASSLKKLQEAMMSLAEETP